MVVDADHSELVKCRSGVRGICKGSSICLGLQSISLDLGLRFKLEMRTDATAAVGICRRRSLGTIRHLATADLWVQDKVRSGAFVLPKIACVDNPSDILTKFVDRPLINKHLANLGLEIEHGRAESAPTIDHNVIALQFGLTQIAYL